MRLAAFALLSAVCVAFLARTLEVRTAITDFLPRDAEHGVLELARELSEAPQSRVVVLTLSADEPGAHRRAARMLAEALSASGHFAWVRGGLSETDQGALYELLFPARLGLLALPEGDGPVPDAFLAARVAALRERLAGPLGVMERRLAPEDPLGAFAELLERQARARGRLRLDGGQLVTEDGRTSVLFAATASSAFDTVRQHEVERAIEAAEARIRAAHPDVTLEWSGVNRYALEGERSVRGDIERISTLSLLGIFLLYFLVFRSPREPLLVLLPIGFGCLVATAMCQLAFGFVHGLALAFGASIIGVAEDYSTHYLTHRLLTPADEGNVKLMRRLWPGMLLGGLTTIAGIATLFGSGFPGLQQMALFGAVGVLGALVCTRELLPSLSRRGPGSLPGGFMKLGERLVKRLSARPRHALWLVTPGLVLMALGLPALEFRDEVAGLRTPTPELDALNRRVQARLGRGAAGRAVVAVGATDEEALAGAERVRARLAEARAARAIVDFRSVAELFPPASLQRARFERLAGDPTLRKRLSAVLAREGFVPEAFEPFFAALARPPEPLTPERVLGSPLSDLIAPFRAELKAGVAYVTPVDGPGVARLVAGIPGVHYLDQEAIYGAAYGRFRARTLAMVLLGLVLVLGTLLARYRSLRVSLLGMLPALLGAGAALAVEGLRGVPGTMMHVIAVLLLLSMGVDYGIYALESGQSASDRATTLAGVLLAALTTVLSFGLLGLSDNPALSAIGATVGNGMVFTVLASPVVLALTRSE